ncbi:MAG: AtpZ/AtpI family protein [Lachnospiraceae bacterium]|nr:AtpZ/AtpI family protein [Lachnospiraceae bacterium]
MWNKRGSSSRSRSGGYRREVYQSLTMILQFGINMLVPVFLCSYIGWWIDKKLGSSFVFILMFILGALAGGRNVYRMARQVYDKKPGEEKEKSGTGAGKDDKNDDQ